MQVYRAPYGADSMIYFEIEHTPFENRLTTSEYRAHDIRLENRSKKIVARLFRHSLDFQSRVVVCSIYKIH